LPAPSLFAVRNAETLEIRIVICTSALRRAVMLFAAVAIGVIVGWTWRSLSRPEAAGRPEGEPPRETGD
jgi:hypothetical protein